MIPKTIHYCWFGKNPLPALAQQCIASWHLHMPDWDYRLWNEDTFDINSTPYTQEAYQQGYYAFVSDYVRLWALQQYGGIYLDVDIFVFRSFEPLLHHTAFAGFEGSKRHPVATWVLASVAGGKWVSEMLAAYSGRHFIQANGSVDLTTNVQFLTAIMVSSGLRQDNSEQEWRDLHIFPTDYFSPRQTTGEYLRTDNTYCEHRDLHSWGNTTPSWKERLLRCVGTRNRIRIIKLKRRVLDS